MIFLGHLLAELLAKKTLLVAAGRKKRSASITQLHASFSLVLLLLVRYFLAKRSMPREKFESSSLVSSIDYRKVQQQELAAKLDGNFAAKCNCTRHVIYARPCVYLTIILRNRAEYHLILSRRGRRPSWLNQGIFRKIEQDNCFIIQQIPIDYHFQNEKNYGSVIKTLKLATHKA